MNTNCSPFLSPKGPNNT